MFAKNLACRFEIALNIFQFPHIFLFKLIFPVVGTGMDCHIDLRNILLYIHHMPNMHI